jgi:predicted DNA binding CopG/RHH family protein
MKRRAKSNRKTIPRFTSEDPERRFWAEQDTADDFDWSKAARPSFPNLKPSTTSISLRLPLSRLEELKSLANEKDAPYQSLLKVFLAETKRGSTEALLRLKVPNHGRPFRTLPEAYLGGTARSASVCLAGPAGGAAHLGEVRLQVAPIDGAPHLW